MSDESLLHETVDMVLRYQAGSDEELAKLFEKLQPRVLRIARLTMGGKVRSRYESMDVAQDVAGDLLRDLRTVRIEEPGDLMLWLATVVRNNVRHKGRHLAAMKCDPDLEVAIDKSNAAMSSPGFRDLLEALEASPLVQVADAESARQVDEAVLALEPADRTVICLRTYAGLSFGAVADRMQLSGEEAAAGLFVRALRRLRGELKKRGLHDVDEA